MSTELAISLVNTNQTPTKLNPDALEYLPISYFNPPILPPPTPTPLIVNIYSIILTHFPTKTIYYTSNKYPMLPSEKDVFLPSPEKPVAAFVHSVEPVSADLSSTKDPGQASKVQVVRRKHGRVIRGGFGTRFWVKKDVIEPAALSSYPFGDSTSLMIRNIPVGLRRNELMEMLDEHCRQENEKISSTQSDEPASEFDFLYLPIDFRRKGNLGYAFVNFTTWQGASRLFNSWKGNNWENCNYNTKKVCQINRAKLQGKEELKKHFGRSIFRCETDEYLPVVLSPPRNGVNSELTELTTIGYRV